MVTASVVLFAIVVVFVCLFVSLFVARLRKTLMVIVEKLPVYITSGAGMILLNFSARLRENADSCVWATKLRLNYNVT